MPDTPEITPTITDTLHGSRIYTHQDDSYVVETKENLYLIRRYHLDPTVYETVHMGSSIQMHDNLDDALRDAERHSMGLPRIKNKPQGR